MATPGSQTMTEFCEQVNPRLLLEMRRTRPFPDMLRVQESWVAATERRALLWLAHVEGSSHDEIADAIGVKAKSVRVLLFRARKRLAEILTKHGMGPEGAR